MASKRAADPWAFRARFRRGTFGWKSQPAITRVREAVAEIKRVAKSDPVLAADGAVLFLERVSPALAQVDSSSGAIGSAVNRAIEERPSTRRNARPGSNGSTKHTRPTRSPTSSSSPITGESCA